METIIVIHRDSRCGSIGIFLGTALKAKLAEIQFVILMKLTIVFDSELRMRDNVRQNYIADLRDERRPRKQGFVNAEEVG